MVRGSAVEFFWPGEFSFVLAGDFDIVDAGDLISVERLSDEDRQFLVGLNGLFSCESEIVPSWSLLIIDLNCSSEE